MNGPRRRARYLWILGAAVLGAGGFVLFQMADSDTSRRSGAGSRPPPVPDVHSAGRRTTHFPGVKVPPPEPNVSGPFVFRRLDLDRGEDAASDTVADVHLQLQARDLEVTLQAAPADTVGSTAVGYGRCKEIVEDAGELAARPTSPPTPYVCLETDEGRIASFRVVGLRREPRVDDVPHMYELFLEYEYTTWERAPNAGG